MRVSLKGKKEVETGKSGPRACSGGHARWEMKLRPGLPAGGT